MIDEQLLRYSRQIMLPQIDINGQQNLLDSCVLIIGMGGLGSPLALYLAACGVGEIIIADDDIVDLANLQRQIIHNSNNIGMLKVDSAAQKLVSLNPEIKVSVIAEKLTGEKLKHNVLRADVVVDATDNLAARLEINRQCFFMRKPLVSASAIRWEGQLTVFDSRQPASPCYQCLYGRLGEVGQSCSENGVVGPVVGMLGCMQANEVIKLITGAGTSLVGRVLMLDALTMEWQVIRLKRDPDCSVCG
jgi:adenylyltransferase/sulfurtransferase